MNNKITVKISDVAAAAIDLIKKSTEYDRGFYAGVDVALKLINSTEAQGEKLRSELYQGIMDAKPPATTYASIDLTKLV